MPHDCQLVGFYGVGRNETTNGNNFGVALFRALESDVTWGAATGTVTWDSHLQFFAMSEGTGNEKRAQKINGMEQSVVDLSAGDLITPAFCAPTGDGVRATITIVLRTILA